MNLQVREELEALMNDELLQVDEIIEWARSHKNSALHGQYNWNEKEAAYEHWREHTRRLIRIHVVNEAGERKLVSLSIDRAKPGGGYRSVEDVARAPALLEIMLDDALRELTHFQKKYEAVKALAGVWKAANVVRKKRSRQIERRGKGGGAEARA